MALDASITRRIRALIPDKEAVHGEAGDEYLFSEEEIEDFYTEGFENAKCAAGLAKMAMGSADAFLLKKIKNYETTTDGAALLKEWTVAGQALYDMGLEEIAAADGDVGIFDVVYPDFGYERHPEGMSHGGYQIGGWL